MEKMITAALTSRSARSKQKLGDESTVPADPWL